MQSRSNANPLIRSSAILRGFATAITLTSLSGMTAFASTHVQNSKAPLQPAASSSSTAAKSSTTASTTGSTTTNTSTAPSTRNRRTTVTSGVSTTTSNARTKTAQS